MGIDAVRLSTHYKDYTFDFYWIPFVRTSSLPTAIDNPIQQYLTNKWFVDLKDSEEPEQKIYNSEFAAKVGAYWKLCDLSLYGFYGWDRIPEEFEIGIDISNTSEGLYYIQGKYNRLLMLGAWIFTCQYYADMILGDTSEINREPSSHVATAAVSHSFF